MKNLLTQTKITLKGALSQSDQFLDPKMMYTLDEHRLGVTVLIMQLTNLISECCALFHNTKEKKYGSMLKVLIVMRMGLVKLKKILSEEHKGAFSFALKINKLRNQFIKDGHMKELLDGIQELENTLKGDVLRLFREIRDLVESYSIPSKGDCLIAFSKYF